MTINFQSGQYFDLKLGWLPEKPKPEMAKIDLPTAAIDDSMAYVIDDHFQQVLDNLKAFREARDERNAKADYTPSPDNGAGGSWSVIGTGFSYNENSMSVNVNLRGSYYLSDSVKLYEEKRSEIIAMKETRGYCDEAVNMLLKELDSQFTSKTCRGLSEQLQVLGYSAGDARALSSRFSKIYLSLRSDAYSFETNARRALQRMGLSKLDIDFGKPGHYGMAGLTGHFLIGTDGDNVENYFKNIAMMEAWSREMAEKDRPITIGSTDGREVLVPVQSER